MGSALFHATCLTLVIVDILARAWRIGVVLSALGTPIRSADNLALTMFGDFAAGVTPWRMAGEPARVLGATQAGVAPGIAVMAMGIDSIATYIVLTLFALGLGVAFGGEWATVVRAGAHTVANPVAMTIGIVLFLAGALILRRLPKHLLSRFVDAFTNAWRQVRAAPPRELFSLGVLSAISLAARVAVLPLIAISFGERPPLGVIMLGSFGLANGQMLVPTPSGAGAVELAAAAGAIGTTVHTGAVLATWRLYLTLIPIVLGAIAGAHRYGRRAVLTLFRRQ